MKVRDENKYQLNQELILDTARDLIVKHGIEQVSLRKIAKESGYSPASLYEYFDSKDSILAELAWRANARLSKKLRGIRKEDPLEHVVELGMGYIEYAIDHTQDFLLAFSHLPSKRQSLDQSVPGASAYAPVLEGISRCVESGLLKPGEAQNPDTVTFGFWSLVHGMAMLRITHLRDFEVDFDKYTRGLLLAYLLGFR